MKALLIGPGCGLPIPPNGWGGIEKVVWKHAVELRKMGLEVDIFNSRDDKDLLNKIDKNGYDVIHVHEDWAYRVLSSHNIDFAFTSHVASWQSNWGHFSSLFNQCKMAMPFKNMFEKLNCDHKHMIENGADPEFYYPETKIKGKCVAVGHDEPRKRFGDIANILKGRKGFELFIIGPQTEKHKIANNIHTFPNLPEEELAKHYRNAEYFFHLSDIEADALVVKEAALSGCKMILSDYCASVVGEGISFKNVNQFMACPEDLGEKAHARASKKFTWENTVKEVLKGYEKIV
ncbi:glycosyltransferase family 4 protein [Candidatus Pacearchaeota archaeon]|nr:glycosyltransferase family 4 protein [Candidatus Pacearchaeota archaeon]